MDVKTKIMMGLALDEMDYVELRTEIRKYDKIIGILLEPLNLKLDTLLQNQAAIMAAIKKGGPNGQ